ncbi:MAG: response regulator [Desulfobulbus sp.]|nr:response regulator [Desulfobulbus sp.]
MSEHRILIVDDHEEHRYFAEVLLKGNGYAVHSAINGAEALIQLDSMEFDLIVSDILMPVMDGFELCRTVKRDEKWCRIPFVIYTATYIGPQDEMLAMKIGADHFLVKPCEPEDLLAVVREALAAHSSPSDSLPDLIPDEQVLKLYNERLVRKLEEKMLQLEAETKALRMTEKALRTSEWKFRQFYESMTEGVFAIDMQGRIHESNTSFQRMIGYTAEELRSVTYIDLTPAKWHVIDAIMLRDQVRAKGFSEAYEKEYQRKDGSLFPAEMEGFLLYNDAREQEGVWCVVRDISEQRNAQLMHKKLEEQLNHAQKMEAIGRLAGGVAHDFNNMLTVILSYAQLGLAETDSASSQYSFFRDIFDAAQRSAGVARKLLVFARHQVVVPKVLDLNETVAGMLKILTRLIGEEIRLHWCPGSDIWPVKIDPTQIDRILANLLVNSRDAIIGMGNITIATRNVCFDADNWGSQLDVIPGEYALLTVSDNGCGMDNGILGKIFEPFFTTKEDGRGVGMGLATVYGIVKQNNGSLDVESVPGKGTTFNIYLPRAQESVCVSEDGPEQAAAIPRGRGETILVAEDDQAVLEMANIILTGLGYEVLPAANPMAAIQRSISHVGEIDLLLTDVVMPTINGRELSELLCNSRLGMHTLYMSGYEDQTVVRPEQEGGNIHFLRKPFTVRDLATKVREALAR